MRMFDVSQMVVLDTDENVVGIIDESDILLALTRKDADSTDSISGFMTRDLVTISPDAQVDELIPILRSGRVAIVLEDKTFFGIITQIDLINYLRNQLP
jgi:cystathionine beta-synthase